MPSGRVVSFDAELGWGVIESDDGRMAPFHSTGLVDGSRSVDLGVEVFFRWTPGAAGRWEASEIEAREN